MSKIICNIFGHKYNISWRDNSAMYMYGTTNCLRCGYNKRSKDRVYFSRKSISKGTSEGFIK